MKFEDQIKKHVTAGKKSISAKQQAEENANHLRLEEVHQAWMDLQEKIRGAFDEYIQPYVFLVQLSNYGHQEINDKPHKSGTYSVAIEIPDFAPILTTVHLSSDNVWLQASKANIKSNGFFQIAAPRTDDYEGVIYWSLNGFDAEEADDFDEALAYADDLGKLRQKKMEEAVALKTQIKEASKEPTYEPMEESGLVAELITFVRGIVDERLEGRS